MLDIRPIIRATNKLALAEGLSLSVGYRWLADGFVQRAYFTREQAGEHVAWCKGVASGAARALYVRDIATGRFVSLK